jgi:hypothetical protein
MNITLLAIFGAAIVGWFGHYIYSNYKIIKGYTELGAFLEMELYLFTLKTVEFLMRKNKEKFESLKESGISDSKLKLIANEDEHDLREFKKNIINVFEKRFPEAVIRRFEITTFEDLAKVAVEYYLLKQGATKVNDDEGDTRRLKTD